MRKGIVVELNESSQYLFAEKQGSDPMAGETCIWFSSSGEPRLRYHYIPKMHWKEDAEKKRS